MSDNICSTCGEDHGNLSHAQVNGLIKTIQLDCPECLEPECTALFLADLDGKVNHVSWCARGHVVVGGELDHMTVYKFL